MFPRWLLSVFFLLPLMLFAEGLEYTVTFKGISDPKLVKILRRSSELVALKKRLPLTMTALRRRTSGDAEDLLKVLDTWKAEAIVLIHLSRRTNMAAARELLVEAVGLDQASRIHFLMDHRANRQRYERQEIEVGVLNRR